MPGGKTVPGGKQEVGDVSGLHRTPPRGDVSGLHRTPPRGDVSGLHRTPPEGEGGAKSLGSDVPEGGESRTVSFFTTAGAEYAASTAV